MKTKDFDEFYHIDEVKKTNEFKNFPPIDYQKQEQLFNTKENYETAENLLKSNPPVHKEEKKITEEDLTQIKKDAQNIASTSSASTVTSTASSIATGAGVVVTTAACAVAVCTNFLQKPPKMEIDSFEVGCDYVAYDVNISELEEERQYYIVVESSISSYFEEVTLGKNQGIITGLKPYYSYTFSLCGDNGDVGGYITYESQSFYTQKASNPTAQFQISSLMENDGSSTKMQYAIYVSDFYEIGTDYYLEVVKDEEVIYKDDNYQDHFFTGSFEAYNGTYIYNLYGTVYGENTLLGTMEYEYKDNATAPEILATSDIIQKPSISETYASLTLDGNILDYPGTLRSITVTLSDAEGYQKKYDIPLDSLTNGSYTYVISKEKALKDYTLSYELVLWTDLEKEYRVEKSFEETSNYQSVSNNEVSNVSSRDYSTYFVVTGSADILYEENINYATIQVLMEDLNGESRTIQQKLTIEEDGTFKATIQKPKVLASYQYNIILHYYDFANGYKEQTNPSEIISTPQINYEATYSLVDLESISISWNNDGSYNITIPLEFTRENEAISYQVDLLDDTTVIQSVKGSTPSCVIENVEATQEQFSLHYSIYAHYEEEDVLLDEKTTEVLDLTPPAISPGELVPTSSGKYQLMLVLGDNAPQFTKLMAKIVYSDKTSESVEALPNAESMVPVVFENWPEASLEATVTITAILLDSHGGNERTVTYEAFTIAKETKISLEKVLFKKATYSYVNSLQFTVGLTLLSNSYYKITCQENSNYDSDKLYDITYLLTDIADGTYHFNITLYDSSDNPMGDVISTTIDTTTSLDYSISYKNPSDVIVTYNDDGTINLYYDFEFSAPSEDCYYDVVFDEGMDTEKHYASNDRTLIIQNIPKKNYYYQIYVYYKLDGIYYCLENFYPSGGVEFDSSLEDMVGITLTNQAVSTVAINFAIEYNRDVTVTISSNGQVISTNTYTVSNNMITIDLDTIYSGVTVELSCEYNEYITNIDTLITHLQEQGLTIVGKTYLPITITKEVSA